MLLAKFSSGWSHVAGERQRTTRRRGDDPRELWELLLAEHARRTHRRPHSAYRAGLAGLEDQRRQRIAKDRANPVATQR